MVYSCSRVPSLLAAARLDFTLQWKGGAVSRKQSRSDVVFVSRSRIALVYRALWAALLAVLAWLVAKDGGALGLTIGVLFLAFALLILVFFVHVRISDSVLRAGVRGLDLRTVDIGDISEVTFHKPEELPVFYTFVCGVYFRGPEPGSLRQVDRWCTFDGKTARRGSWCRSTTVTTWRNSRSILMSSG